MNDDDATATVRNSAEQSVLGAMMLSKDAISEAAAILSGPDFYRPDHELVFDAALDLYERNIPADPVTVAELLTKTGDLGRCGGAPYLHLLINSVPTVANAGHYAEIVRDYAAARRLSAIGTRLTAMGDNPATDLDDIAELYHAAIRDLTAGLNATATRRIPTAAELFVTTCDGIENPVPNRHVPTGIHDLDAILGGGLNPGQLALIAARPSVGKSVLGLGMARAAAIKGGIPTLLVTLEMSGDDTMRRLISAEAGVNLHHLQSGDMDDRDWGLIARVVERVQAAPLYIDDTPGVSAGQLRAAIRDLRRTAGLGLVIVDYLQLMTPPKAENREQRIAALSRDLKAMAQEFAIPVVALAQLNRESEKRSDKRPAMSDLRESGSLEQEADVVVLIHREDAYEQESPRAGEAELIVAKNRSGPKSTVTVAFQGHHARFVDMAAEPWTPHSALKAAA